MGSPSLSKEKVSQVTVTLRNKAGLHARPVGAFARVAKSFRAEVTVKYHDTEVAIKHGNPEVNGKTIMSLLQLDAHQGAFLAIEAVGEDATEATAALVELVRDKFGEPE